jgi:hypothetical protein
MWCYAGDVRTHRLNHRFEITGFVGVKPIPVIVALQVDKKLEEILIETVKLNRDTGSGNDDRNKGNANNRADNKRKGNDSGFGAWATDS